MEPVQVRVPLWVERKFQHCTQEELDSVQDEISKALARELPTTEIKERAIQGGWDPELAVWLISAVQSHGPQKFQPNIPPATIKPSIPEAGGVSELKKIEEHLSEIRSWVRLFGVLNILGIVAYLFFVIYESTSRR